MRHSKAPHLLAAVPTNVLFAAKIVCRITSSKVQKFGKLQATGIGWSTPLICCQNGFVSNWGDPKHGGAHFGLQ